MSATHYALAADALLALHVAVVVFVVGGMLAIGLGGWRGWAWVRSPHWRIVHLLTMLYIATQAALGKLCPLTIWEQALRARAGESTYSESFIGYWLGRLLYIDAPWWAFVVAYVALAALVAASWWWVRPRAFRAKTRTTA
jgi:hypothetical protein